MKRGIVFIIVIIMVISLTKYVHLHDYLTINYLHEHVDELKSLVTQHYWLSVGCYMGSYICATAVPLPGSSIFSLAGGLLFGPFMGMLYAMVSATMGATILFWMSRYLIGTWVQRKFALQLEGFNKEMQSLGHYYLLLLRLLAVLPFGVVNMFSGLTHIPLKTYICVTMIGLLPMSFVYAYTGNQLGVLQKVDDFFSPQAMTAFLLVFAFKIALFPAIIKIIALAKRIIKSKSIQVS